MPLLDTHFWLLCGAWVGGVGAISLHLRLRKAVAAGELDAATRKRFVRGWLLALLLPCVMFWLLQLSAGPAPKPDLLAWPAPQKWIALAINVACWLLLLWWVWLANGAQQFSRVITLAWPKHGVLQSPFGIKMATLLLVAGGIVACVMALK